MQNNSEEAPPQQQAPTHYAVPANLYAAIAKVLMAQTYGEVAEVMEAFKRCQGLTITPNDPPQPTALPPELAGRGGVEG